MEADSFFGIPRDFSILFHELEQSIEQYNQEASVTGKEERLRNMKGVVDRVLKSVSSLDSAQHIQEKLKEVKKIPYGGMTDWNEIWRKIEGKTLELSPSTPFPLEQLPPEIILEIVGFLNRQGVGSLSQASQRFHGLVDLSNPKVLSRFLDKFSSELTPKIRFELALKCGKELTKLDLNKFQEFNDEKLNQLINACPNLQSLNLSFIPITTLANLPKNLKELYLKSCRNLKEQEFEELASFSRLEKLDVSGTRIDKLDIFPQSLKELYLRNCFNLSAIDRLHSLPQSLKELYQRTCYNISEQEWEKLASLRQLEKLDVSGNEMENLDVLPKNLKELIT